MTLFTVARFPSGIVG